MALISISNCPICAGTEFNAHLSCRDYTVSHENFSLKQCVTCQFVFTDPRPDDPSLANYYRSEKYISHTGGSQSLIDNIYLQTRKITLGWKRKLIKKYVSESTLLDVGCGTGEFLKEMQSNGWKISGIEPADKARKSAEGKTKTKIYSALSEIKEKDFNVITLWHVLEHLPDPNQALHQLHHLLNETGTIFIAVPNLKSYDANYYQSYWAAYDVPRHLWHFDQQSMKTILEKNGLQLVNTMPMRLDSFYVSLLSESYKHPKTPKFVHLIRAILLGLKSNFTARKTLDYSSLIYVVKR